MLLVLLLVGWFVSSQQQLFSHLQEIYYVYIHVKYNVLLQLSLQHTARR